MTWRAWEDLASAEVAAGSGAAVALLPVAAVEQHGPHLPLGTDAMVLDGLLARTAERGVAADVLALPAQRVGDSLEHTSFPGTLHVEAEALVAAWCDLGRSVARAGVQRLAIVNAHGGQPQLVDLVAQRLRREAGMLVARITTFHLGGTEGLFEADELRFGLHGGEVETSLMLHVRPDLVRMDAAQDFRSAASERERGARSLEVEGGTGIAWQAEDLNPHGVTGNAARADAERGRILLDRWAERLGGALEDLARWPLPEGADPPTR